MMKLLKIAFVMALLLPCYAQAATWVKYDTESAKATYYYDIDSIKFEKFNNGKKYIRVWEDARYTTDQSYEEKYCSNSSSISYRYSSTKSCYKSYRSVKTVNYYDCQNNLFEVGAVHYFNNNGEVVVSNRGYETTSSSTSWSEVIPGSVSEGKLKEICKVYRHRLK